MSQTPSGFELTPWVDERRARLEAWMDDLFAATEPPRFSEALSYPLRTGGKRIRPALCFAAYEALAASPDALEPALAPAAAVELVHTYSLVHDDLPAMDDDDERRGRPTVHVAYDEATAILVGDALLTEAFAVLARAEAHPDIQVAMIRALADAAGHQGMVGGQALDIGVGGDITDVETLTRLHRGKTGALIAAAVRLGGLAAGADDTELELLERYGAAVGLAFQLADDVLDADEDEGEDGPPSYVKLLGVDATRARALTLEAEAAEAARALGPAHRVAPLIALAHFTVHREV